MESLSAAELQIIRSMLVKQYGAVSPFLDQLAAAGVEKRRMTGAGVFVDLQMAGNAGRVDQVNSEISEAFPTRLPSPLDIVGFTLFIRSGCLSFLEGYTFGDADWPNEPLQEWLVLPAAAANR